MPVTRSRSGACLVYSPTPDLSPLQPAVQRRHEEYYPETIALLGCTDGTVTEKRKAVEDLIKLTIQRLSPRPRGLTVLARNYRGHNLTRPKLDTTRYPGRWTQTCFEDCADPDCARRRLAGLPTRYEVKPALPADVLQTGRLGELLGAREELSPRKRSAPSSTQATVASSSSAPPSPPSPQGSPAPSSSVAKQGDQSALPDLQPLNRFHFHNGGYGGFTFFSPDGQIVYSNNNDASSEYELGYPESDTDPLDESDFDDEEQDDRGHDLTTPVYLIVWGRPGTTPDNKPVTIIGYPRIHARDAGALFSVGEVVLRDVRSALRAAGIPIERKIERYYDGNWWSSANFKDCTIQVYGTNKVVYLRSVGADVTPPAHHLELFALETFS
ncbi:hypothetical protein R3P38DRAFT_3287177 [Favolaschia claudopus]|uniref:Uncharacterized protein n=1 Tax=Favolaschia claudopus TaxID=2862362 RepID=A0AAW0A1N9_9AGAR